MTQHIELQSADSSAGGITQQMLFDPLPPHDSGIADLPELFRRIYYHLYTNSKASRAELIIEDLALLLLSKLAEEVEPQRGCVLAYLKGKSSANRTLLPFLRDIYPELIDKHQSFSLDDRALKAALAELERVRLMESPAHILGEAFQALIGPRLRGERGQFFTPRSLVRAMVRILDPKPHEAVLDPACGTGGFLAETHIYQTQRYEKDRRSGKIVGVEKDRGLSRLATAMLRVLCGPRATIGGFSSFSESEWNEHFASSPGARFDVILTNPPFGTKIGVEDRQILSRYDFGHAWLSDINGIRMLDDLVASQDPQMLFLELCARLLKPGGRMGIVLPEGMFGNRSTSYIWHWLSERGDIIALLDCPRTTFQPGTDTKTNVLFWRKRTARAARKGSRPQRVATDTETLLAVAVYCGHDRRGRDARLDGSAYPNDFSAIATDYHRSAADRTFWKATTLRSSDYLVPRYHYAKSDGRPGREPLIAGAQYVTLGELQQQGSLAIRKGHEVGSEAYGSGDVPFVRTSDLSNFEVSADPTKCVSEDIYNEYAPQQLLKSGDVLMAVDGRYRIGATAILNEHNCRCVVQSHIRILSTADPRVIGPYELLFALSLDSVKRRIRSLVFVQSTLGTLGARLLELQIPLLHGDGPWTDRVTKFQNTLAKRAALLTEIRSIGSSEVEL